uniref:PRC-barrel domain-containing protein n=1 Tax=Ruegeria arenilitoris TaxID=1173585 RepID=UPI00147C6403|nr:PRC-barrel domain-containing protein [Ruegeria arenilitoris]
MKRFLTTTSIVLVMSVSAYAESSNVEEVGKNLEEAAEATGDALSNTAQDIKNAAQNTAEDVDQAAEATGEYISEKAGQMADAVDPTTIDIEGYVPVAQGTIPAEDLTGMRVYDVSQEWIGEIEEVVVDMDGSVDGAVIGVGGFLGLGEKDVLIDFSRVSLMREVDGDATYAFVHADKEMLKEMPAYEGS